MTKDTKHSTRQVQATPGKRVRSLSASSGDLANSEDPTPVKKLKTMESNELTEQPTQSFQVSPDSEGFKDTASKATAESDNLPAVAQKKKKHVVFSVPTKESEGTLDSSPGSHGHHSEEVFNLIAPTAEAEGKETPDLADSSGEENEEEGEELQDKEGEGFQDEEEAELSDDEDSNDVYIRTTSYGGSLDFDIIHAGEHSDEHYLRMERKIERDEKGGPPNPEEDRLINSFEYEEFKRAKDRLDEMDGIMEYGYGDYEDGIYDGISDDEGFLRPFPF